MTERERLIELIGSKVCGDYSPSCDEWQPHSCEKCYANDCRIGELVDYLLANGVIVPPCKVGQKVWCILNRTMPVEFQIAIMTMSENRYSFTIETKNGVHKHYCDKDSVGKWVFFSRKEAEKALEGSRE